VIEVSGVHKGEKKRKVVVRFPDSTDVRWRNAPKFKKGQKGTWLLHKGGPGAGAAPVLARAAAAPSAEVYTALDPNDFHSASDQAVVQALLPSTGGPAVTRKKSPVKAATARKSLSKKTAAKAAAKGRRKKR
jgi:NAD(P)H-hydrate repair Nnr-like enzyme with NAD(P)H-hydrate dehydratase domain